MAQNMAAIEAEFAAEKYELVIQQADSILSNGPVLQQPRLHQLRADSYYYLGDLEKSLESYFQAIHAGENAEVRDNMLLTECYSHAGFCYREMGLYQNALPHYQRSLQIAKKINADRETAEQYYNLGTLYQHMGDYDRSIKFLDSAYQIDVARGDSEAIGFDLSLLSELRAQTGDYEEALYYAKESLAMYEPGTGNANSLGTRLHLVGNMFMTADRLDSASHYLDQAAIEFMRLDDQWRLASCWLDRARLNLKKKQFAQAIEWSQRAQDFYSAQSSSEFFILSNNLIAEAYSEMLLNEKALEILEENQKQCEQLGQLKNIRENYQLQAKVLALNGSSAKAESMKEKHKALDDSLLSLANLEQLNRLALQVKFDKLEQENQILTEQHELVQSDLSDTTKKLSFLTIAGFIAFLILLFIFFLVRNRLEKKNQALEEELGVLRRQIKTLLEGDTSDLEVDLSKLNHCLNTPLTDREFEILTHAIGDLNNSQIADKVFLSVNTVKYHLKNIYDKLGVSNRKQALEYVVKTT
ncbi:MAG: tetratricopeptide repeat protein [Reichenbachiella sp.]|uniref:tetratricopeptide repeat protein n=1 Tax=Reichenbachiella sp. TaxID=2184521 RepID=UPI002966A6A3|nr:tetratricopeptide repeat protein [Reichenbachiella sp.]MDW3209056.1 tetratricopeptide repeat protein [Reichenbachiella sp.]